MVIRGNQLTALSESAAKSFEDRVAGHLEKCFPGPWKEAGEFRMRETIRYGIQRAATYGVTTERDVCKYIDIMIVFGRDFDQQPELPWASEILNNQVLNNASARVESLYTAAQGHSA